MAQIAAPALMNVLVLLGMAFLLSRAVRLLSPRSEWQRLFVFSTAFSAMAIGSMLMSFPIGIGVVGDFRSAVFAIAAIVGGPIPALIATVVSVAFRVWLGGHYVVAVIGILIGAVLSITFARSPVRKTPLNLVVFGLVLAGGNALLPLIASAFSTNPIVDALHVAVTIAVVASVAYPLAIATVGGLLLSERQRMSEEAEIRAANAQLSIDAARTQGVFERSDVSMAWCDLKSGRFILANPQYARFTGYSEAELVGMRFEELSPPEDQKYDRELLKPFVVGEQHSATAERRYLRKDGKIAWGLRSLTAVNDEGGSRYALAMVQDITEGKRAREEIAYLASHDFLTGLFNRAVFKAAFAEALARCGPDEQIGMLYLDLDDFKMINDARGHPTGDAVLVEVARRIRACVAADDVVSRFGGDEFAILRTDVGKAATLAVLAARLVAAIREPILVGDVLVKTQTSIGIAIGPRDGLDPEDLIKRADIALYAAKGKGSLGYQFFEPEMERRVLDRQALKADLSLALTRSEMSVEYQPIVDLRTGRIAGFEALLRWHHPTRGQVLPATFIPLAEENGLIGPIGDWVLANACRQAATWPPHLFLAVNISPVQFSNSTLPLRVAHVLAQSGLDARRLEFEVTESVVLHGSEENMRCLEDLRRLGIKFALDDFGTGYASLAYLQKFPFDKIKIDRSFVSGATSSKESAAVVDAVVRLGHSLGMGITAEGVETRDQLKSIRNEGCDFAQGYLFSKSVQADECLALVERIDSENAPLAAAKVGA